MNPILFIHPDPVIHKIYQNHFSPSFSLDSAHDGLSAIRKIRLIKPQIVISEYELPKLSGLGVLKFLRQHPELYATPFVFLTDHYDAGSGLSHGANGWFKKSDTTPQEILDHTIKLLKHKKL